MYKTIGLKLNKMSEFHEGGTDTLQGFECLEILTRTKRSPKDWLTYLEKNNAFRNEEVREIVQSLNLEGLSSNNNSIYALNGELFEGKNIFSFSTSSEAARRCLLFPNAAIICLLYEWLINDEELLQKFEHFVVVGEEFEDSDLKLFYLNICSNNGDPYIDKFYLDMIPPIYASSREAYIFEGQSGLSS